MSESYWEFREESNLRIAKVKNTLGEKFARVDRILRQHGIRLNIESACDCCEHDPLFTFEYLDEKILDNVTDFKMISGLRFTNWNIYGSYSDKYAVEIKLPDKTSDNHYHYNFREKSAQECFYEKDLISIGNRELAKNLSNTIEKTFTNLFK
jgi:hypothetical protein